jgi:hypothetical protein
VGNPLYTAGAYEPTYTTTTYQQPNTTTYQTPVVTTASYQQPVAYTNYVAPAGSEVRKTSYNYGVVGTTGQSQVRNTTVINNDYVAPPPKISFGHPSGGYTTTNTYNLSYLEPTTKTLSPLPPLLSSQSKPSPPLWSMNPGRWFLRTLAAKSQQLDQLQL